MIDIINLHHQYADVQALSSITLQLQGPQIIALLGSNGAGKTTTIKILVGALKSTKGEVWVCGEEMRPESEARRLIGYLPETPPLYPEMTVGGYLLWVAGLRGVEHTHRLQALEWVLQRCDLSELRQINIAHLSKGMKQRVGLAQALIHQPPILILDEIHSGLDPKQSKAIHALLRDLSTDRLILLSTHRLEIAETLADTVLILDQGQVRAYDTLTQLKAQIQQEEVRFSISIKGEERITLEVLSDLEIDRLNSRVEDGKHLENQEESPPKHLPPNLPPNLQTQRYEFVCNSSKISQVIKQLALRPEIEIFEVRRQEETLLDLFQTFT